MRSRDEHGAVAVIVAVLMVPLVGFVALAVDVSAAYVTRVQLQNGADAAALAVAADCLSGACGSSATTARTFASANFPKGTPTTTITAQTASSVTVQNSAVQSYLFAPVLGIRSATVSAKGTATWTGPTSGTAIPVAINLCEYNYFTGGLPPSGTTSRTMRLSTTSASSCPAASGEGGYSYLKVNSTACRTTTAVGAEFQTEPGDSEPSSCSSFSFDSLINTTILLPVFSSARKQGNTSYLKVYGYAAFRLTGYYFGSGYSYNASCNGSERCLRGYFTTLHERSAAFTYGSGAPQLGAASVTLSD